MSCGTCGDKGIVKANWSDAEPGFAICCCFVGLWFRSDRNAGRKTGYYGWQVWCAANQIDPSRVYLLEEVLTAPELAERGFTATGEATHASREAALLAAGKGRKGKL